VAAAIGLVIDDAIVVVENIYTHVSSGQSRRQAVQSRRLGDHGSDHRFDDHSGRGISAAHDPDGVTGVFFRSLALTMSVALLTSLVLALSFTPVLAERFVEQSDERRRRMRRRKRR
jgi:multidrug efflux pump subunit AcrB